MNHINDITALDKAISRTGTDIQHFNTEHILHLRNILIITVFIYSITFVGRGKEISNINT